jgi:hypothetical protein
VPTRWLGFSLLDRGTGQGVRFASTTPLGSFSPAFLKTIALTVKQEAANRKLTAVVRS